MTTSTRLSSSGLDPFFAGESELLEFTLETSHTGAWVLDLEDGTAFRSLEHDRIFGYDDLQPRWTYDMFLEHVIPEDRENVDAKFQEAVASRTDWKVECRISRDDGAVRWIWLVGRHRADSANTPRRMAGIVQDITDRKRADERVRQTAEKDAFRVALWDGLRSLSTVADIQLGAVRVLGEYLGANRVLYGDLDEDGTTIEIADNYVNGMPKLVGRIPVPSSGASNAKLRAGETLVVRDVATDPDVSKEERDLMRQHEIGACLSVPLIRNGQWISNLSVHQRVPRNWTDEEIAIVEETALRTWSAVARAHAEKALQESRERLRTAAEDLERRVEERTRELVQSQERLRALATELSLAEQRERKRIAGDLHDHLQQMLVLGKLKLGQGKRLVDASSPVAGLIQDTDNFLSDALKYTRTLVADLSPPILRDHALSDRFRWLAQYLKNHGLNVTVEAPETNEPQLPENQAVLLFQSVRELLINASKHAQTHEASVSLRLEDSVLRIEVKDRGAGFDPMKTSPFESAPTAMSSMFGLFSIRERMRALGGAFEIDSSPGRGTTAVLTLPLTGKREGSQSISGRWERVMPTSPTAFTIEPHEHPKENERIRVLLVDDHAMVRQGLRSVLESYPDVDIVGEAWNGEEAKRLAEVLKPAVVIMDVSMPKMNGVEATAAIKARHPETVVIGLSVNAGGDNQTAMLEAGAAALITKEAAVEQLYTAIQQQMAKKS